MGTSKVRMIEVNVFSSFSSQDNKKALTVRVGVLWHQYLEPFEATPRSGFIVVPDIVFLLYSKHNEQAVYLPDVNTIFSL